MTAQILGTGDPVVLLLPGGAESADGFFPGIAEPLVADGCRVIVYDRPGTGESKDGALLDAAADLHAMLAGLGVGPVIALGQSLGGAVALLLAHDFPQDVAGLVLLDPTPINDHKLMVDTVRQAHRTARIAHNPIGRALVRRMLRSTVRKSVRNYPMTAEVQAATLKIAELDIDQLARATVGLETIADRLDLASLPRVPAVVVTADRKATAPPRIAHERIANALGAPLVSWPKSKHHVHLTNTDQVLEVARDVVRQVVASR